MPHMRFLGFSLAVVPSFYADKKLSSHPNFFLGLTII